MASEEQASADQTRQALELRTFKAAADHALDGIAILDLDRKVSYANAAYCALTGFGDSAIGALNTDFLAEGELRRVASEIRPAIAAKRHWAGTLTFRRPDGSRWLARGNIVLLHDDADAPYAYVASYRDVTDDVLREHELRARDERHRALLEAVPDLMLLINADGILVEYKGDASDTRLEGSEQLIGRRVDDTLPPELAMPLLTAMREVFRTRRMQVLEYSLPGAEGPSDFEGRVVACGDDHALVIARDITARRRAEKDLLAVQAQVIAAQQATLRELATPIMPIADGVIAMPLIGAIDSVRASQILEALLDGIASQGVRIAIVDITGVKVVDVEIASALLRAAQAARLLGAQVVLTGIGPRVAQTFVALSADLSGTVICGTLKAGIAYALR